MRCLLLSPNQIKKYNWGHQLFRNEIGRQIDVTYYGAGFPRFNPELNVKEIVDKHCPDVDFIMTYGWRYSKDFEGLEDVDIPKVHITVDYGRPAGIKKQNIFFKKNKYDIVFGISLNAMRLLRKNNVCDILEISPFSVDCKRYRPLGMTKNNQILAAFSTRTDVYPNRSKIQRAAKATGYPVVMRRVIHGRLIQAINRSKIILTSNNIFKSVSMRYTETMACGGFLLADEPEDMRFLGYVDKRHFVLYRGLGDLKDKINFYMKNNSAREKIARLGMRFVRKKYNNKKRAREMLTFIKKELDL